VARSRWWTPTPPAPSARDAGDGYGAPNIRDPRNDDELHQELMVIAAYDEDTYDWTPSF
jgi:hypothetical protein